MCFWPKKVHFFVGICIFDRNYPHICKHQIKPVLYKGILF
jgi:hypothetical protein